MKLTRRTVLAASVATLGSPLVSPAAKASPDWPTKAPIRLIATFPPGIVDAWRDTMNARVEDTPSDGLPVAQTP